MPVLELSATGAGEAVEDDDVSDPGTVQKPRTRKPRARKRKKKEAGETPKGPKDKAGKPPKKQRTRLVRALPPM